MGVETIAAIFKKYMVNGIVYSGIFEDGGQECYDEIPKKIHVAFAIVGTIFYLIIFFRWKSKLLNFEQVDRAVFKAGMIEYLVAFVGAISLILTGYMKLATGKGMFLLNPCHVSVLGVIVLCVAPSTTLMRKVHSMWTAWLFGATLALLVPHLNGIGQFEIWLYYIEHLVIVPIGPIVLFRRYGALRPTFANQFACFSSLAFYQLLVLFPLSYLTKVNLNFALCHSPGDPLYPVFGLYYFFFAMYYLNFASYLARWFYYFLVYPLRYIWKQWRDSEESSNKTE